MKYVVSNREDRIVDSSSVLSFRNGLNCYIIQSWSGEKKKKCQTSRSELWGFIMWRAHSPMSATDLQQTMWGEREEDGGDNGDNREDWSERQKEMQACGRRDDNNSDNSHNMTSSAAQSCEQRRCDASVDESGHHHSLEAYDWPIWMNKQRRLNINNWVLQPCGRIPVWLQTNEEEEEEDDVVVMKICCQWFNSGKSEILKYWSEMSEHARSLQTSELRYELL